MFPHVPLQAITLDLVDTHSVSLTVDRILSHSIYIPGHEAVDGRESDDDGGEEEREALEGTREDEEVELEPLLETPQSSSSSEDEEDEEEEFVVAGADGSLQHSSPASDSHSGGYSFFDSGRQVRDGVMGCGQEEAALCHSISTDDAASLRLGNLAPVPELSLSLATSQGVSPSPTNPADTQEERHEHLPYPQLPYGLRQRPLDSSSSCLPEAPVADSHRVSKSTTKECEKSTSASFFTSLQERKADLLQKARR